MQRHTSLDRHGEVGLVDRENLIHLLVRQDDVTTDKARRDRMHGSDDLDFGIFSVCIFDNGLNLADAAGFLELVVRNIELDLVVPVHKARHFDCARKYDGRSVEFDRTVLVVADNNLSRCLPHSWLLCEPHETHGSSALLELNGIHRKYHPGITSRIGLNDIHRTYPPRIVSTLQAGTVQNVIDA